NPQDTQMKSAWLLRDFFSIHPQALHRREVYGAGTSSTRPGALCSVRWRSRPHPWARMARFSPAFCRTCLPGCSNVPFAEAVMFLMSSFSNLIRSKVRASVVLVFSHQSLRRSASRALSLATFAYSLVLASL